MTRENKLALVVGFGLLLTVGILISDHFSKARDQQYADQRNAPPILDPLHEADRPSIGGPAAVPRGYVLRPDHGAPDAVADRALPVQPTASRTTTVDLDSSRSGVDDPDAASRRPLSPPAARDATGGGSDRIDRIDRIVTGNARLDDGAGAGDWDRYHRHVVKPGESMIAISRRYFGDTNMVATIATLNDLDDPDLLQVGVELRIPRREVAGRVEDAPRTPERRATARPVNYTVQRGDTLSEIAQAKMGSSRLWRRLYEHNRTRIDDPDRLVPGTVLEIPPGDSSSDGARARR